MAHFGTCGTCKYRGAEDGLDDRDTASLPPGYFLCTLIVDPRAHQQRTKDGTWDSKGLGAIVQDASGYHAALCVEADFGCNKWEPAQSPTITTPK